MSNVEENLNLEWMDEKVQNIKGHNFLYNFMCFITFRLMRKMKYKELFLVYYGIHRKSLGEKKAKQKALDTILKIYKQNNGKMPDGILEEK